MANGRPIVFRWTETGRIDALTVIQPSEKDQDQRRAAWMVSRRARETQMQFQSSAGTRSTSFIKLWRTVLHHIHFGPGGLHLPPLHRFLKNRTKNIRMMRRELTFPALPSAFDGYTIIHLSDMHFGELDGIEDRIAEHLAGRAVDVVLITGDYVDDFKSTPDAIAVPMQKILGAINARDGVFAVLGNHDSCRDVAALEALGIRVLVNESHVVERGEARLVLTGTDDPSHFFEEEQAQALMTAPAGFRIAMVHSAELADYAENGGFSLYLSGHTHGGQVCLPGGRAILVDLKRFRDFGQGMWSLGGMQGITSHGAGASVIPYRVNCPGEIGDLLLRTAR